MIQRDAAIKTVASEIKGIVCFYVLDITVIVQIQGTRDNESFDSRNYCEEKN